MAARNEAEQTLRRAVQLRDEFLSVASHELRTPLTALNLQLEGLHKLLAAQGAADTDKALRKLDTAIRQGERLNALVEGLLAVAQLTSGRPPLDVTTFDLAEAARHVVARLSPAAARAGSEIRLVAPEPVTGAWDRARLEQALANLLGNAIKYGARAPIDVEVVNDAGGARVTVQDHGIGISEADQGRIFGCFERAVPLDNYGGLGLGLFIAHQIVEAHGGDIEVQSAPSEGSTFTVRLPRNTAVSRHRDTAPEETETRK